jgi:hypothetical protein
VFVQQVSANRTIGVVSHDKSDFHPSCESLGVETLVMSETVAE